jgi:trimeric autotransporter adhesin
MRRSPRILYIAVWLMATCLAPPPLETWRAEAQKTTDPRLSPLRPVAVPMISGVTLNPSSVTGGTHVGGTVTLAQPAPSGGVTVKLQSSNQAVANVPQVVVIQPGTLSSTFVIQTYPVFQNPNVVTSPPSVDISAQIGNLTPRVMKLTVYPASLALLTLDPASVGGGTASTGKITITGPAPSGGFGIALSSKDAAASVPQQITIPAGAREKAFPITTRGVTAPVAVQIVAARGVFVTKTATLTVLPPAIASLSFDPTNLKGGNQSTGTVRLTTPAPAGGVRVSIERPAIDSSRYPCAVVPTTHSTVQIAGGSPSGTFVVLTHPSTYHSYEFRVSYAGSFATSRMVVIPPMVDSVILPSSVKGGTTAQGKIELRSPAHRPECSLYKLESLSTLHAQVPPAVPITPGVTTQTFSITTSAVPSPQTVTIRVTTIAPSPSASNAVQATMTVTP